MAGTFSKRGALCFGIELITLLAVIQLAVFGILVSRARVRYKLALPAMAGQPQAERYIRAHLNSVEWLGIFLASLWIAALHWNPLVIAGLGLIYLVGRILYFRGYVPIDSRSDEGVYS